jgi:hypothetical protein
VWTGGVGFEKGVIDEGSNLGWFHKA